MEVRSVIATLPLAAWLGLFPVAGCAGAAQENLAGDAPRALSSAPDWVVGGCRSGDGTLCGVGSATGSRDEARLRATAVARGRGEIAQRLFARLRAALEDYASTAPGTAELGHARREQRVVDVGRQLTELALPGAEMADRWVSGNGTVYALVTLDVATFSERIGAADSLSEALRRAIVERADGVFAEGESEAEPERRRPETGACGTVEGACDRFPAGRSRRGARRLLASPSSRSPAPRLGPVPPFRARREKSPRRERRRLARRPA